MQSSHAALLAGTDSDKALALSFILAGGPLEKYRQGGKSKAHKKFIKILPDRKMAYDAKAVGPITGVKEGGAEFHTTDEEVGPPKNSRRRHPQSLVPSPHSCVCV
jgi:hypothetical protein